MKLTKILGAAALGVTLLGSAHAVQAQAAAATGADLLPTVGTKEISLAGYYNLNGIKSYALNLGLGYFISPAIEVGGQLGVAGYSSSGSSTTTNVSAFADYYFSGLGGGGGTSTSALLPFVGVLAGYSNSSGNGGSGNTSAYGAEAGVKYFLNPNVSVNGFYEYLKYNNSNSTGQSNNSSLNLGLSTYFR